MSMISVSCTLLRRALLYNNLWRFLSSRAMALLNSRLWALSSLLCVQRSLTACWKRSAGRWDVTSLKTRCCWAGSSCWASRARREAVAGTVLDMEEARLQELCGARQLGADTRELQGGLDLLTSAAIE